MRFSSGRFVIFSINIGSETSVTANPTLSIYVASKSAVNGLTRCIDRRIAICGEFPFAKVRHDRFDVLCDLGGLSSAQFCPDAGNDL